MMPPLRKRVRCVFCARRRVCWMWSTRVGFAYRWTTLSVVVPTCDDCLFELKYEGEFDDR